MSKRKEFDRKTRNQAFERSRGHCEARGPRYGLGEMTRCNGDLSGFVEFHHEKPLWAGGDSSLDNCVCACRTCHRFVTAVEAGERAKADRMGDKHKGTWKRKSRPMPGTKASGIRKRMSGKVERR